MKKNYYEAPEAELFVVRIEKGLCQSKPSSVSGGRFSAPADVYDMSDDDDWGW